MTDELTGNAINQLFPQDWPEEFPTTVYHSAPVRVPDGCGGFLVREGTLSTLRCRIVLNEDIGVLVVNPDVNIRVGDLIRVPYSG